MAKKKLKLGARIDKLRAIDLVILTIEKQLKEAKQRRAKLEGRLLREFEKEAIDGCKGRTGVARIRHATFFSIKDRRKFDKYVLKHKALDLFQNRISATAYKARLDEGEAVPGVGKFDKYSIGITKRK